jgi:hypothetical protein
MNGCLVETSADVLPPPLKLNVMGGELVAPAVVPDGSPKEKAGEGSAAGLGSTTGAGEVVPNEKGAGVVVSCSVLLAGGWSKENTLPPSIPLRGLGASIFDEHVLATSEVPSLLTNVALGSVLEEPCDPKAKDRGDGEGCGGTVCPKVLLVFAGFPSNIGASPTKLSGMEDGTFPPVEDLDVTSSKLTSLLGAGNKKGCVGSAVLVDPNFGASNFPSAGLLKEKGSTAVGVTDAEDNNRGAKAELEEDDGVPVAVFSTAGSTFCADLSSKRLDCSPSQKGFSASLTGRFRAEGAGSVGTEDAVKFNTGGTGEGVFAKN